jgi:hypothetical protein
MAASVRPREAFTVVALIEFGSLKHCHQQQIPQRLGRHFSGVTEGLFQRNEQQIRS